MAVLLLICANGLKLISKLYINTQKLNSHFMKKQKLPQITAIVMNGYSLPARSNYQSEAVNTEAKLSATDEQRLLHNLNTLTAEQMREEKAIPFRLSQLLCKYREANGPFKSINEVEKIKSVGPKAFRRLCQKLLTVDKGKEPVLAEEELLFKCTSPELTPAVIESAATVTSLEVCLDAVYYCTMTRDLSVVGWNHIPLLGSRPEKQTPAQILEQAYHILESIPKSSLILMENRLARRLTSAYLNYILFISRLQMCLQTLLEDSLRTCRQHRVFHIKDTLVVKTFGLRVGGERVSGQNILQDIEAGQFKSHLVKVEPSYWLRYNNLESDICRERYANCLLLTLAFYQHALSTKSDKGH